MATTFDEIYDLALMSLKDYKLDNLFQVSPTDFSTYLQGFLIRAIPKFTNCKQNLESFNLTSATFNITLTMLEKDILATLMGIEWFTKEINDVNQFSLHLNDTDFKHYSEAQNLKEKMTYLSLQKSIINQQMSDYGLANIVWADWINGSFF